MAVRRLAPKELQPASFAFSEDNLAWAKMVIGRYPSGRQQSAVIPLLWRAQEQQGGWLTEAAIRYVADMLDMPYIRALEVATFYTQFQLQPVGRKAHVQVCGTTPCRLRGAGDLIEVCKHRIHHDPFALSADGDFSWEEVECQGVCVNAPMAMIGKDTYEDLTVETFEKVLAGFASGNPPKPGPQNGRHFSAPLGGPTTLKDYRGNGATAAVKEPVLADAEAKKPGEAANTPERPSPKPPADDATRKGGA
jgi:NADH-quinone oxidoreductase subunit E